MGVISTGAIFKTLTFDGRSSSEFNVYITGEGVFNAPERAVEMISIPGRNGAFALDYGRFENIEVTYNCGIAGDDDADFASAISDFRNWLCSRNGYVRLSDDYNAGEYRMAVYKSGLEVTAENLKAGEFPVVFECKPQRFLTSGETAVAVTSGDTITNPTLFDSRPMLEVTGYGNINLGSDTIEIHNEPIGDIEIYNGGYWEGGTTRAITVDTQFANVGDAITVKSMHFDYSAYYSATWRIAAGDITSINSSISGTGSTRINLRGNEAYIETDLSQQSFVYGTSGSGTVTASLSVVTTNYGTITGSMTVTLAYDGADTFTLSRNVTLPPNITSKTPDLSLEHITLTSSQPLLGNPLYIDLDIGEAYKIEGGSAVSVNNGVVMPAELPTLTPGTNTITFDNTITGLDIVPRWFKI